MSGFGASALPEVIPVFPLENAIVLPRGQLPLNIFEPRYLAMVKAAMGGDRLIGMIQPKEDGSLFEIGGLGRITQFTDPENGRLLIVLTGVTRFRIAGELDAATPYRQVRADYSGFTEDFQAPQPMAAVLRADLETTLRTYLDTQGLSADWEAVSGADDESLVNTLAAVCPFDVAEKQALLEAKTVPIRAATLCALMTLAQPGAENGSGLVH
ncbi:LON peptidase substrate-binding domain-containing protein [Sphingosinicella microcystinivorans]|uniref:LON peptidase substrate-binding domain-containing protein n=1 Tax=Sphingosinicella microcystinivorans TaxID=335406 RepID=UPI0022F39D8A|nr:LON peptidase substrate-binding domain-containing protein [Sphingosinicella microcystinivorans]WBX85559.1 LON peptidase substrate-binding domain-containing protein [Sphingosinicella microcystinivorans]